jgi:hypothetical protein
VTALLVCASSTFSTFTAFQPVTRLATTADALVNAAVFFHGKQVVIRQPVGGESEPYRLEGTSKPVFVFWKEPPARADGELRGEFWDLGRLQEGDARFSSYNFRAVLDAASQGVWPARDRVFVILNATLVDAAMPPGPTVRAIALAPDRYLDREVRVVGRFRGRNLYGDVPQPLNKSKWDFVIHSADAALWVTGMRPKGDGFDLDPGARVDTGRWIEVTGVVKSQGSLLWIEATQMRPASAPAEMPVDVVVPDRPVEPPPRVVFSAPVADDIDVERGTQIRVQFSRIMNPATFKDRVRISYVPRAGDPDLPPPAFKSAYNDGPRALEIKFAQPLERFQTVKVDLLPGITAIDGQALAPWTLTFTTGS